MKECRPGHYANGFRVGYDNTMGSLYDDSYLTAIELRCSDGSWIKSRHSTDDHDWKPIKSTSSALTGGELHYGDISTGAMGLRMRVRKYF